MDRVLQAVVNNLKSQHYNFSNDWIDGCAEFFRTENPNHSTAELQRFILDQWLLADLREMEAICLPPHLVNQRKTMLPGKYALQVEAMLDISVSCYSQHQKLLNLTLNEGEEHPPNGQFKEPKANRMWQLTLCDGTQVVKGLEHETIAALGQPLIPGTKVLIMGPVLCRRGQLMLTARNIQILGGEIDSMIVPNAYENILCQKLGLPLNPDPYNENPAAPNGNAAAVLPNAPQPTPPPCNNNNNNLPPLLPAAPPGGHWDEQTQSYMDDNHPDPHPSFSDDDDLIDAAVDAQLLALERQHIPEHTGARLQEQQYHDSSDIINLSDDEDLLQSFDLDEIERRAMAESDSNQAAQQNVVNRRNSYNEMRPSVNPYNQSLQSPPGNRLLSNQTFQNQPTIRQSSNQPFQNQPTIHQSSYQTYQNQATVRQASNQEFQNQPIVRQSSNQTFQNQPSVYQSSNQTFQNQPTMPQSSNTDRHNQPTVHQSSNQPFQNQATTHQSSSHTFENQSKVCQPTPSSSQYQTNTSSPSQSNSPSATKQTKLTSFLKISKPGEILSQSPRSSPLSIQKGQRNQPDCPPSSSRAVLGSMPAPMVCGPEDSDEAPSMEVEDSRPSLARTVDGRPFVYLSQLGTASGTVYTVKAFVMTVVSKVSIRREGWHLAAKICDGSATQEVAFSSDVVESLIGFSPQEVKAMRSEMSKNPNLKEKLVKAFDKAQNALIDLNCLMEVELRGDGSLPCVVSLVEVTETHFTALRKRLDTVKWAM